jgi:hypothetical protein
VFFCSLNGIQLRRKSGKLFGFYWTLNVLTEAGQSKYSVTEGITRKNVFRGAEELVTAFCIEALARYQQFQAHNQQEL